MLFKDLLKVQNMIEDEWHKILEIKDELEVKLKNYNQTKKEMLEYILNFEKVENITINSQNIFNKISRVKQVSVNENFNFIEYQKLIINFERKYNEISENNIFSNNFEWIKETSDNLLKIILEYYHENRRYSVYEKLMYSVDKFINSINQLNEQFNYIKFLDKLLENDSKNLDQNFIIELRFYEEFDVKELTTVLIFILQMYEGLKNILKKKDDLKIIKMETGSFWAKLSGDPVVIDIILSTFKFLAKELYYSKLNPLKKREIELKDFRELIDLKRKMEEAGVDTKGINAEINAVEALLFKRGKTIIESSNKIEINNEIYESKIFEKKRLMCDQKLLEYKEDLEILVSNK